MSFLPRLIEMREGDARQAAQDGTEDQSRQRDKLMGQRGRHACLNVLQLRRSNQMGRMMRIRPAIEAGAERRKKIRPRPPVSPRSKLMRESRNERYGTAAGQGGQNRSRFNSARRRV
jgi:hypothetical protein